MSSEFLISIRKYSAKRGGYPRLEIFEFIESVVICHGCAVIFENRAIENDGGTW
jgi:hypothetical protein